MQQATVYKSTGSWYDVKLPDQSFVKARIKGRLKQAILSSTNPVAVGDLVLVEKEENENLWLIDEVLPRENYMNRQSPHNKHKHHIIAANLSQAILLASLKNPTTSLGFIDRFLVSAEAYHIPAVIVINKSDTWAQKQKDHFEFVKDLYNKIGYKVLSLSVIAEQGTNAVQNMLAQNTSLLSGHSGVGKTTFINFLLPGKTYRTDAVSDKTGKGQHTTTFAEMFDLPDSGRIIDTPGIRELGLVDITPGELSGYFPEMRKLAGMCKYNNCVHYNEPGCAVKDALNDGTISEERYVSYLNLKDSILEKGY